MHGKEQTTATLCKPDASHLHMTCALHWARWVRGRALRRALSRISLVSTISRGRSFPIRPPQRNRQRLAHFLELLEHASPRGGGRTPSGMCERCSSKRSSTAPVSGATPFTFCTRVHCRTRHSSTKRRAHWYDAGSRGCSVSLSATQSSEHVDKNASAARMATSASLFSVDQWYTRLLSRKNATAGVGSPPASPKHITTTLAMSGVRTHSRAEVAARRPSLSLDLRARLFTWWFGRMR